MAIGSISAGEEGCGIRRRAVRLVTVMLVRSLCTLAGFIAGILIMRLYYLIIF